MGSCMFRRSCRFVLTFRHLDTKGLNLKNDYVIDLTDKSGISHDIISVKERIICG